MWDRTSPLLDALSMVDRGQKTVPTRSGAAEIIFPDMPHAPCPAVGIQTATQDAPTGQSFCMFLRSVLKGNDVYITTTTLWAAHKTQPS